MPCFVAFIARCARSEHPQSTVLPIITLDLTLTTNPPHLHLNIHVLDLVFSFRRIKQTAVNLLNFWPVMSLGCFLITRLAKHPHVFTCPLVTCFFLISFTFPQSHRKFHKRPPSLPLPVNSIAVKSLNFSNLIFFSVLIWVVRG